MYDGIHSLFFVTSPRSLWQSGLKCIAVSVWLGPGAPSVATSNIRPCVMVKVPRPLHSSSLIDTLPASRTPPLLINLNAIHCIHTGLTVDHFLLRPFLFIRSNLSLFVLFTQLIVYTFTKHYFISIIIVIILKCINKYTNYFYKLSYVFVNVSPTTKLISTRIKSTDIYVGRVCGLECYIILFIF